MKTAARLVLYDDILDPKDVFSLIALTSYYNQFYAQTSRAFIRLESLESLTEKDREVRGPLLCSMSRFLSQYVCRIFNQAFSDLAMRIFTVQSPVDPGTRMYPCPNRDCNASVHDWYRILPFALSV
jgi:WD repeat-containing protein 35